MRFDGSSTGVPPVSLSSAFVRRVTGKMPVLLLALAAGCSANKQTAQTVTPELAGSDPAAQMDFWHALPERRVTSNDEAFHALLLFTDGQDPAADYAGRVELLRSRGMLPAGFDAPADAAVQRGTLAVALARALNIKGGLTMRLFGPSPRYAVRELQYMGIIPPSSPNQAFTGPEFLGIIGRAEDYQRLNGIDDPLEARGGETQPVGDDAAESPDAAGSPESL